MEGEGGPGAAGEGGGIQAGKAAGPGGARGSDGRGRTWPAAAPATGAAPFSRRRVPIG